MNRDDFILVRKRDERHKNGWMYNGICSLLVHAFVCTKMHALVCMHAVLTTGSHDRAMT